MARATLFVFHWPPPAWFSPRFGARFGPVFCRRCARVGVRAVPRGDRVDGCSHDPRVRRLVGRETRRERDRARPSETERDRETGRWGGGTHGRGPGDRCRAPGACVRAARKKRARRARGSPESSAGIDDVRPGGYRRSWRRSPRQRRPARRSLSGSVYRRLGPVESRRPPPPRRPLSAPNVPSPQIPSNVNI